MARRCTTVPGFGFCCQVAQQGLLGRPVRKQGVHGERCAQCDAITRRNGRPGFKFRWHKSDQCGIGPGGCPALAQAQGGTLALPAPGQFGIIR